VADRGVSGEAIAEAYDAFEKGKISSPMAQASLSSQTIQESMRLLLMVRAFQVRAELPCPCSHATPKLLP
jgi:2-oxoglutarate dehydrogenase E1 component